MVGMLHAGHSAIRDAASKLIWEDTPHVAKKGLDHKEAAAYCSSLRAAGLKGWRLPSLFELQSIVDYRRYKPAIMKGFQNISTDDSYWTNTKYAGSSDQYWVIDFEDGALKKATEIYDRFVRCVHDPLKK